MSLDDHFMFFDLEKSLKVEQEKKLGSMKEHLNI